MTVSPYADPRLLAPADVPVLNPCGLNPVDVVTGIVQGREARQPLPEVDPSRPAARVLEDQMLPALRSGRCLVSFSGGRDSSWTLAVATHTARREGLPDPVPVTITYPQTPEAQESRWQEGVVAHLGLRDWERIPVTDELEVLGPYARRALTEVGLLFPANAYCLLPQLDRARDGWLILGLGASDFFMFWHWSPLSDVLARRRRPHRSDLAMLTLLTAPRPLRRRILRRQTAGVIQSWVREPVRAQARNALAAELASTPVRFDAAIARQRTHRCYAATQTTVAGLARLSGARAVLPHLQPDYLAAIARESAPWGPGDRTTAMRKTAGALLPAEVLARRDGANLQRVLMGSRVRDFADTWSGQGIDAELVDPEILRRQWRSPRPDWRTTTLLQLAAHHDIIRGSADGS